MRGLGTTQFNQLHVFWLPYLYKVQYIATW